MVGKTGGRMKTLSKLVGRGKLKSINCHERTEITDLLERLRPKQDGRFEWSDEVVISAMRDGVQLLIDEISLAEDSVLERLNVFYEEDRSFLINDATKEEARTTPTRTARSIVSYPGSLFSSGNIRMYSGMHRRFVTWLLVQNCTHQLVASIEQAYGHLKIGITPKIPKAFSLKAPTCAENFCLIARGLLINNSILLEGAPGCRKSSTSMALAQLIGNPITRLNLNSTTTFRWEDGPVLKAIKKGEWILLDETNLASQSVLEGLNACFDHRRVLYIAELNREFEIPSTSNCRFFACQNPRVQGGNRRALPKSFINRFTNIYTNDLSKNDIEIVLDGVDNKCLLTLEQRKAMVTISEQCEIESERGSFIGGPYSFNLRDLLRWYDLLEAGRMLGESFELVYMTRTLGPRNCGKRAVVENVANICGKQLKSIALNADTDAQELIGSYEQVVDEDCLDDAKSKVIGILRQKTIDDALLEKIQNAEDLNKLEAVIELIMAENGDIEEVRDVVNIATQSSMRFEWKDSVFVDAYLNGDWLLIEDVNLCSAAVLDRLNSCLESGGRLVIAERQNSYEPLEPHPDFRVFLSMDAKVGEISRAMRNRSVEIYLDENARWNCWPNDVKAVVGSKISDKWSKIVSRNLTAEQQLHMAALLEENGEDFSVDIVWKLVDGHNDEFMEEGSDGDSILEKTAVPPKIEDIVRFTGEYEKYIVSMWKQAASTIKISNVEAIPMTFLSTTPWILQNLVEELKDFLGNDAVDSIIKRVPDSLRKRNNRNLIDSEFSSRLTSDSNSKFSRAVLFEWIVQMISKIPVDQKSAEYLSSTMTKYEIATCDVTFTNLPEISHLVRSVVEMFKTSTSISNEASREVCISISYLLLVAASRRKLTSRTGCAAIYLAWNDIKNEITKISGFQCPQGLSVVTEKINKGWTSESYETFVTEYIHRWRKFAICRPFKNEDQTHVFVANIGKVLGEDIIENDVEMLEEEDSEDVSEEKKKPLGISPIELSTNVVESVDALFEFLATGIIDQENDVFKKTNVYSGLEWKDEKYSQWIRTASVFCATIASCKLNEEETEDQNILVSDLLTICGGAHCIATRLFFSAIHYNPSMSNLSIAHLQKFPIKELGTKLWRIAVNSSTIYSSLKNALSSLGIGIEGWTNGSLTAMWC
ncbi:unnamed protein product [Caenorhabditis brenneri]